MLAFFRASARLTLFKPPKPISCASPLSVKTGKPSVSNYCVRLWIQVAAVGIQTRLAHAANGERCELL